MAENNVVETPQVENIDVNDEEAVLTMVDVLQEEQELLEDTQAVLGGSDHSNCTYNEGYIKRQALYACVTCTPPGADEDFSKAGGVCLACSYKCHEGHTLVELYTKRNFRCDCGNKKFENVKCSFNEVKDDFNESNSYNQNFVGLYCTCKRPYPDPEATTADEMIQCAICEDWYHVCHLKINGSAPDNYEEMICQLCMEKYDFLQSYIGIVISKIANTGSNEDVDIEMKEKPEPLTPAKNDISDSQCKKPTNTMAEFFATFWPTNWRAQLCTCDNCIEIYEKYSAKFIIDNEDPVQVYEEKGKKSTNFRSQYEEGMEALSSLDRVKQVEAISEYNEMKSQLKEYLQKFVDNKKVVREEDIKEFFSSMTARKKQRVEIPHFCH